MPPAAPSLTRHVLALAVLLAGFGFAVGLAGPVGVGGPVPPAAAEATGPRSDSVLIEPDAIHHGYSTSSVTITQDGTLSVVNLDTLAHTVTSVELGGDGKPLFDVRVEPGSSVPVPAASTLAAGTYHFFCKYHPDMTGTLTVLGGSGGVTPEPPDFSQPLFLPEVRTEDTVPLAITAADQRILPSGPLTHLWTYDGTWPGPTIRRPAGATTRLRVSTDLEGRGGFSLHLHGDHHASRDDGRPNARIVRPERARTYSYPLRAGGRAEPGSFFWYHDHRMDRTSRNNTMGLQGMFVVDDPDEAALGLPTGDHDLPLMISDRSFTDDNQLVLPARPEMAMPDGDMRWTGPAAPPDDASVGDRVLVNGRLLPYADVTATRYRLRLLNSSSFSAYNLRLSDGRPFVQIGTGDGLLPRPVVRQSILLGPSQRADVVVDFHGASGQDVVLSSGPRDDDGTGTGSRTAPLMQFRVGADAVDDTRLPAELPSPPLVRVPDHVSMTWTFGLTGDPDTGSAWTINGRAFDPHRVDHVVRLGSVERWRLRNTSDVTHYVHLHEEQWRTVSRDGGPPLPWERGLEDTWRLDPGEVVEVAARFTDHTGRFMVHCHMLDHEDHGMMAQFRVVRR